MSTVVQHIISSVHYLTQDNVEGKSHPELAERACRAGINWVQLRTKNKSESEWEAIARDVLEITQKYNATLIINDNVSLALKIKADGVHLGKEDMDPLEARNILGPEFIIGGTANIDTDILRLSNAGVDYIGLGPYRFTETKKNLSPVLKTAELVRLIHLQHEIPVILIGGIKPEDIPAIASAGADGIAISSAINLAENPMLTAMEFVFQSTKYFRK
jgi:thiamine-phosphate pyrophosphorylase